MVRVVVFHHALGLTSGVLDFADHLRAAGHVVETPDLYDGVTFDSLDAGVAHAQQVGFADLIQKAVDMCAEGEPTVFVGFSLGAMPAQRLTQTSPCARGGVLFHACGPHGHFSEQWPEGVPAQIHAMVQDPWFVDDGDLECAHELVDSGAPVDLFLYPGDGHLFLDDSVADYDPEAAALALERVQSFLAEIE